MKSSPTTTRTPSRAKKKSQPKPALENGATPHSESNGNGNGKAHHADLTNKALLAALRAYRRGEFDVRLPDDLQGIDGQICEVFNEIAQSTQALTSDMAE